MLFRSFPTLIDDQDFRQDLHVDCGKVRRLLGYADEIDEARAMRLLARAALGRQPT